MKSLRAIFYCLLLAMPLSLLARTSGDRDTPEVLRKFVQSFYDWYVPKALGRNSGPAWNIALKARVSDFSPELALRLREDSEAQAKAEGEIAGLDFDPFLNSQDPRNRYKVGRITNRGENYWVDIYCVLSGKASEKPIVIAEVSRRNGQLRFVDFRYPNGQDLLGVLRSLRESREKPPSR